MSKANHNQNPVQQYSFLFWLDHDGNLTLSGRLSLEARARIGGNFDHNSVMDVLYLLEGGDVAYEYETAAIDMVDYVNALGREEAIEFFKTADMDTLMHLRPLGMCCGIGEMEARGLFNYNGPRNRPKRKPPEP